MRFGLAILVVAICAAGAVALAAASVLGGDSARRGPQRNRRIPELRQPPAEFGELKDTAGIACIAMPEMPGMPAGAMGIHYVNGTRVGDPA